MFAEHTGIDVRRIDSDMRREQRAEPRGVEDRTGPDYAMRRHPVPAGEDGHNLGHDVERIGRHKKDGIGYRRHHRRHDLREDFGIARQEVQSALARPLAGACGEHDDTRAVEIGQLPGPNPEGIRKRRGVQNVTRLGHRQICIAVDEHDLGTDATHHHGVSGGSANLSDAYDPDLHALPPTVENVIRSRRANILRAKQRRPLTDEGSVPALDRWRVLIVAEHAQRAGIQKEVLSRRGGRADPARREHAKNMPMGE